MSIEAEYHKPEEDVTEQRLLWLREAVSEMAAAVRNEITQPLTPIGGGAEMVLHAGQASAAAQERAHEVVALSRNLEEYAMGLHEDELAASLARLDLSGEEAEVKLRLAQALGQEVAGELRGRVERLTTEIEAVTTLAAKEPALAMGVRQMQRGLIVLKDLLAKFAGIDRYLLRQEKNKEGTVTAMFDIWASSDAQNVWSFFSGGGS